MFDKITDAPEPSSLRSYIPEGNHVLIIDECIKKEGGPQGDSFIVHLKTESSDVLDPGARVSFVRNFTKQGDMAISEAKAFAASALHIDFKDITSEHLEGICSPDQPLNGEKVACQAKDQPTKSGNMFTKIAWSRYTN